ncbi:LINE-1 type transposase domain-containing protein 1 [Anabarilius grahami]|uniref:LINE-1 type transposase domain-containing protein 1 n=1 Tax=Anabarilius grahami TaxID=495550 RepID=A0A3N0YGR3_ANAGA|nr:LINE-1 type transposase domain-containing protein 1 [Anabarilius grahami]
MLKRALGEIGEMCEPEEEDKQSHHSDSIVECRRTPKNIGSCHARAHTLLASPPPAERSVQPDALIRDSYNTKHSQLRHKNTQYFRRMEEDTPNNLSTEYVSKLLMEAFTLEKEPFVDRAHRTLAPKPKPGECPCAIVARLHYYTDCANILKKSRELQRIKLHNMTISVFPDYTAKTARARAAFIEVRRQLRDIEGVRFGILHPAKLRITYEGVQRDFTSPAEAKAFISKITK